jgi:NAD(P)H-dependent FMN reductase
MIHANKILVIIGSTRARRIGPQVAAWVAQVGATVTDHPIEIVDLKAWPLPMDDEPAIPATGDYAGEHTQAWSRKVSEAAAIVLVSPQYNWGYPAPLKNALDHLHREWAGKPAMIVTYGGHGGDKCAVQLRVVAMGLRMRPVETMPGLALRREHIEANTGLVDAEAEFAAHLDQVRQAFVELDAALAPA